MHMCKCEWAGEKNSPVDSSISIYVFQAQNTIIWISLEFILYLNFFLSFEYPIDPINSPRIFHDTVCIRNNFWSGKRVTDWSTKQYFAVQQFVLEIKFVGEKILIWKESSFRWKFPRDTVERSGQNVNWAIAVVTRRPEFYSYRAPIRVS